MFKIGDQVVHKIHGAGEIISIEEKTIDGELLKFIRVQLTLKEGDILIPLNRGIPSDIRYVIDENGIKKIELILSGKMCMIESDEEGNPPDTIAMIESNDPYHIAQAIRTLTQNSKSDKFELEERELLSQARMQLAGELMLAKSITKAAASSFINRAIHGTEKIYESR